MQGLTVETNRWKQDIGGTNDMTWVVRQVRAITDRKDKQEVKLKDTG